MGTLKTYLGIWWTGIKKIPETTSIHGFRFITDSRKHWSERLFWLLLVLLSWYGSALLIAAQYEAYQNNSISFVVETTYNDWNTHFPSVAFCENDNIAKIEEVSDRLWGEEHDFNIEEVLREVAFFKGVSYYTSQFCGMDNPSPDCFKSNLTYFAYLVRSSCEEIISNCSWNGESFNCCKYFLPIETELGICFAVNSIQGRSRQSPKFTMISNKTTGPGVFIFHVLVNGNVYVHNEEDVPSLTTLGSDVLSAGPEMNLKRLFTIRNIENDAGARIIAPEKRKCRYTDENILDVHRHYSYSACTVQCRKKAQLELCNCTNFFIPNVPEQFKCDIEGIICLNSHKKTLSGLKAKWSSRDGLYCDCLPSCTEADITVLKDFKVSTKEDFGLVHIELAYLPSERYRRNVVRGILDLVVSTGGTGGLFLGASLLSFVELVYIIFLRPMCDIYSQRGEDDPWFKKFGTRSLKDNKFVAKIHPTKVHHTIQSKLK